MYPSAHGSWHRLLLVMLMLFACLPTIARAQGDYPLKASLVARLMQYTTWPEDKLKPGAPFVIGVIGQGSDISDRIKENTVRGYKGREVVVKVFTAQEEIAGCCVLFVSSSELSRQHQIVREANRRNVLTFGETSSFDDDGGIITFIQEDGHLKFTVSDENRKKARLKISAAIFELNLYKGGAK